MPVGFLRAFATNRHLAIFAGRDFGSLATYGLNGSLTHSQLDLNVLLDASDRERVEGALSETSHVAVSAEQLAAEYDGPCTFGKTHFPDERSPTWSIRFSAMQDQPDLSGSAALVNTK